MLGETLGRSKVADVDERVFGQVLSIVGATVDNGHHVVGHRPEQFLGDVVGAQRVLEGQVEAVVVAQQVVAGARAPALGVAVEAAAGVGGADLFQAPTLINAIDLEMDK